MTTFLLLISLASAAHSVDQNATFVSADDALNLRDRGEKSATAYMAAAIDGIQWTHSYALSQGHRPLYCQPENLSTDSEMMIRQLRKYLQANPDHGKYPVSLVLLQTHIFTFPCPGR